MDGKFLEKKREIESLKNGQGIKYLLDEAFRILGNPIMMFDTSYTLLMHNDVATDDWVWNEIAALGTFTHETVNFFNQENFIEAFAVSETVAFMKSKHLKYERANGKLFDSDNVQLGNISVVACCKPFEEGDMELIEIFCEILSVELQNSEMRQKIDRVYQESLLDKILNGGCNGKDLAGGQAADFYDGLKDNLYLAVVDIAKYDKTNTHLAYFRDLFKKLQSGYKYYVHLNNIVIIISTDNEILRVKDELYELNAFFERYSIYAGISGRFHNISNLKKCFKEAIAALHYGLDSGRMQNIFCYDDFRIEHHIYSAALEIDDICSPVIKAVQKYDQKNKSRLYESLYAYLLYGMNIKLACAHLKLTEKELRAELKILEDIFDVDWTNGDMLNNLFLSIKINK